MGLCHPKASLLIEADAILLFDWQGQMCCVLVLCMLTNPLYEWMILKAAALEAIECGGSWIMKLRECLKSFGWQGVGTEEASGLSSGEIRAMLETCAKRRIESDCIYGCVSLTRNQIVSFVVTYGEG